MFSVIFYHCVASMIDRNSKRTLQKNGKEFGTENQFELAETENDLKSGIELNFVEVINLLGSFVH